MSEVRSAGVDFIDHIHKMKSRESQYTYSRAGELQGGRLAHSVQSTQDVAR